MRHLVRFLSPIIDAVPTLSTFFGCDLPLKAEASMQGDNLKPVGAACTILFKHFAFCALSDDGS